MKLCMTAVYTHLKFKYGHERIKKVERCSRWVKYVMKKSIEIKNYTKGKKMYLSST